MGIGRKEGTEAGCDNADGGPVAAPDAEAGAAAAPADDAGDTKGGDRATIDAAELPSAATAGPRDGCSAASTAKTFESLSTPFELTMLDMRRACSRLRDVALYKRRKPDAEPTTSTLWSELKRMSVTLDCSASSSMTARRESDGSSQSHKAPSHAPANKRPGLQDRAVNGWSHVVMVCMGQPLSMLNTRMRLRIFQ